MTASANVHGNSDVTTLIVTMTIHPDHEKDFVELAASTVKSVHDEEPETLLYALHTHPTEPHTYVWVERYSDVDAMRRHADAPYMAQAMNKLPHWLSRPPEMLKLGQVMPG